MKEKFLFHLTASGLYTSMCLASLSISTDILLLKKTPDWEYFCFLFFIGLLYYNFQKITWYHNKRINDTENIKYRWPALNPGLLLLLLIIGLSGSAALFTQSISNWHQLILGGLAALIALIYNTRITHLTLRSIKGLKAFSIALVAIISGVIIPVFASNVKISMSLELVLFIHSQFFFITALCIAADIRDVSEDKEDGIKTFPVAAGLSIAKKIAILLVTIQIVLLGIAYQLHFINVSSLELLTLISMLSILVISNIHTKKHYYYFILIIDGLIALQAIGLLILNH